jgi:hypothetical protein
LPVIDYRTVKPLQGKLKKLKPENYEKLKNVLTTRGFRVPLFLWADYGDPSEVQFVDTTNVASIPPKQATYWLMDGHGRQKVMMSENMTPYEVPYVLIDAKDAKEAKAQLLEITSQYQTITKEGFAEFTIDLEPHELEAITFDVFEIEQNPRGNNEKVEYQCPECGHVNSVSAFKKVAADMVSNIDVKVE